jgi:hypothetical protein
MGHGAASADCPDDEGLPALELWLVDLDRCGSGLEQLWNEAQSHAAQLPCNERSSDAVAITGSVSVLAEPGSSASGNAGRQKQLAHSALRLILARRLGAKALREPFVYGPRGKPGLASGALHFSLSHTHSMALVGVSRAGPVGVDLEAMRPVRLSPIRRAHLESLAECISGHKLPVADPERRFMQAWVRLEAYAKATGEGIGGLLERSRQTECGGALTIDPGGPEARGLILSDLDLGAETLAGAAAASRALDGAEVLRLTHDPRRMAELLMPVPHGTRRGWPSALEA